MNDYDILEDSYEFAMGELCELLPKLNVDGPKAPSDIEIMDMLLHSIKSAKTTMAMLESEDRNSDSRYSGNRYSHPRYEARYSGKRDSMGRYTRDSEKSDIINRLEGMMNNARTEDDAVAIKSAIDTVKRLNER